MKIIKSENKLKKDDKQQIINDKQQIINEVIENNINNVSFTITLTKKQYKTYISKGGICWLKKMLSVSKKKGEKLCEEEFLLPEQ